MTPALRFEADLRLVADGRRIDVGNDDRGHLVVTVDGVAPLLAALPGGATPLGTLRWVAVQLRRAGATVQLRTASGPLLLLGAGAEPGALSRVARLGPVEIQSVPGVAVAVRPSWRLTLAAAAVGVGVGVAGLATRRRR